MTERNRPKNIKCVPSRSRGCELHTASLKVRLGMAGYLAQWCVVQGSLGHIPISEFLHWVRYVPYLSVPEFSRTGRRGGSKVLCREIHYLHLPFSRGGMGNCSTLTNPIIRHNRGTKRSLGAWFRRSR